VAPLHCHEPTALPHVLSGNESVRVRFKLDRYQTLW
jgi:hypothetical protein